jgi:hypothetical protein
MNTVGIASIVPPAPPTAPPLPTVGSGFSDLLASSLASGAALPPTPGLGIDASNNQSEPSAPSNDTNTNTNTNGVATVAIPVPLPHQQNAATPNGTNGSTGGSGSATPGASSVPASAAAGATGNGSTGTGTGNGSDGQNPRGAALPPTAAQLNARIAVGAQGLISQPAANLASLAHTAQTAAPGAAASPAPNPLSAPATATAQHGTTAPDPDAMLKSSAGSTTGVTPDVAAAEQNAAQATTQSAATAEARSLASAPQAGTDPTAQQSDPSANSLAAPPAVPQPTAALGTPPATQGAAASTLAASTLDQIAFNLRQSARTGLNQIEIQLKPASLGSIDVKLEMTHDGRMTAVISSDRSDTLNLLQRNSGELQQALRDAGLQTDTGSLSFNLRGEQQQPGSQGQQSGYLAGATPTDPTLDEVPAQAIAAAAASGSSSHAGLLNIQV